MISAGRAWLFCAGAALTLVGCTESSPPSAGTPGVPGGGVVATTSPASPPAGAPPRLYKVGKPYKVADKWYYPQVDLAYEERGIASWYGPNFHGKRTANGEIFDMSKISAAHRTLPMPSVVRVTNLENGRSLIVRINDRGPFARGRIIDLSRRAAELLGFTAKGTAMVHVRLLTEESRREALEAGATDRDLASFGPPAPKAAPSIAVTVEPLSSGEPGTPGSQPPQSPRAAALAGAPTAGRQEPPSPQDNRPRYTDTASLNWGFGPPAGAADANPGAAGNGKPQAVGTPRASEAATPPATRQASIPQGPGAAASGPRLERMPVENQPRIFIQAGAFRQFVNANRLRARLTTLGHPVDVSQVYVTNQPFFRVRLGPLGSVEDADLALERVVSLGYPEAQIVVD